MREARDVGFPILVKAARGGGGKGMKLAVQERDLQVGPSLSEPYNNPCGRYKGRTRLLTQLCHFARVQPTPVLTAALCVS